MHLSIWGSQLPNPLHNQLPKCVRVHTTSETREIFALDIKVNAVYFYSSVEVLESVASSRVEFVYDKLAGNCKFQLKVFVLPA